MTTTSQRLIQKEEKSRDRMGGASAVDHYNQEKRYTLDMVRIDNKIREVVNHIKLEEAKKLQTNKIEDAAPKFQ